MRRPSNKALAIAGMGFVVWAVDGMLRPLAWLRRFFREPVEIEPTDRPGTFTITCAGKTTRPIAMNATLPEIEKAANEAGLDIVDVLNAWVSR